MVYYCIGFKLSYGKNEWKMSTLSIYLTRFIMHVMIKVFNLYAEQNTIRYGEVRFTLESS